MKKLCLLLALVLVFTQGSALALNREEVVPQLESLVESYLKQEQYIYTYSAGDHRFDLDFELDSQLKTANVSIYLYDDMISVVVFYGEPIPQEHLEKMAVLSALVNISRSYAYLRVNLEDATVSSRSFVLVESVLPGIKELEVLLHEPLNLMDDYGDAIYSVMTKGEDPHLAFQAVQAEQNSSPASPSYPKGLQWRSGLWPAFFHILVLLSVSF